MLDLYNFFFWGGGGGVITYSTMQKLVLQFTPNIPQSGINSVSIHHSPVDCSYDL